MPRKKLSAKARRAKKQNKMEIVFEEFVFDPRVLTGPPRVCICSLSSAFPFSTPRACCNQLRIPFSELPIANAAVPLAAEH